MSWTIKYCNCEKFRAIDNIKTCTRSIKLKPLLESEFCSLCGEKFKSREPEIAICVNVESNQRGSQEKYITLNKLKELLNAS